MTLLSRSEAMGVFDWARSAIDRAEALKEDLVLSRDDEFVESLDEANDEFRSRDTLSVDEMREQAGVESRTAAR
jgi:hypothetical protein